MRIRTLIVVQQPLSFAKTNFYQILLFKVENVLAIPKMVLVPIPFNFKLFNFAALQNVKALKMKKNGLFVILQVNLTLFQSCHYL